MSRQPLIKKSINTVAKELQLENSEIIGTVIFHGKSMSPFLEQGDELIVKPLKWKEIKIGDVVTYRFDDKFPTYRVIRKFKTYLLLKPDNWQQIFEVKRKDLLGKVIERKRVNSTLSCTNWKWTLQSYLIISKYWEAKTRSLVRYYVLKAKKALKFFIT
jgi:signal peptidase I